MYDIQGNNIHHLHVWHIIACHAMHPYWCNCIGKHHGKLFLAVVMSFAFSRILFLLLQYRKVIWCTPLRVNDPIHRTKGWTSSKVLVYFFVLLCINLLWAIVFKESFSELSFRCCLNFFKNSEVLNGILVTFWIMDCVRWRVYSIVGIFCVLVLTRGIKRWTFCFREAKETCYYVKASFTFVMCIVVALQLSGWKMWRTCELSSLFIKGQEGFMSWTTSLCTICAFPYSHCQLRNSGIVAKSLSLVLCVIL